MTNKTPTTEPMTPEQVARWVDQWMYNPGREWAEWVAQSGPFVPKPQP